MKSHRKSTQVIFDVIVLSCSLESVIDVNTGYQKKKNQGTKNGTTVIVRA